MDTIAKGKFHAVLLSSPGMGHVFPVIELGRRLTAHHGFHVYYVIYDRPLTRSNEPVGLDSENALFDWLDRQPAESVISLGSGGTHSADQLTELAAGLELSEKRFIWVLRPPTAKSGCGSFFSSKSGSADMWSILPDGFLERTQGTGLVVRQWAPQVNVLTHAAVRAFMSHCGWNSILESIVNRVPMIAWPLYAEQRMNVVLLEEDIGVAFRPKVQPSEKTVEREEITVNHKLATALIIGSNLRVHP